MRVPVLEENRQQTRAMPTPYSNLDTRSGLDSLAQGVQQLGAGLEAVQARAQEAKRKGDVMAVTDAETAYQHDITSTLSGNAEDPRAAPGFLTTRGQAAAASSTPTLEKLDKRRGQIAQELLSNDEQRRAFMARSNGMFESARHQVEGHVSQQGLLAQQATLKARQSSALQALPGVYTSQAEVARLASAVEGPIRELALSPADADAQVAEWRSAVFATQLQQYLAAEDWKGAEKTFERVKGDLAPKVAAEIEKHISSRRTDADAEEISRLAVARNMRPNGSIDAGAAVLDLDKLIPSTETELLKKARLLTKERALEIKQSWDEDTKNISTDAYSLYNEKGWTALHKAPGRNGSSLGELLNERTPPLYDRLKDEIERKFKERNKKEPATMENTVAWMAAKADMTAHPELYKGKTSADLEVQWGKATGPLFKSLGEDFARTQKDEVTKDAPFRAFLADELKGNPRFEGRERRGSTARKEADHYVSLMGDELRTWRENHQGQNPSLEDLRKMNAGVYVTVSKYWGFSHEVQLKPRDAAPAPADLTLEKLGEETPAKPTEEQPGDTVVITRKKDGKKRVATRKYAEDNKLIGNPDFEVH